MRPGPIGSMIAVRRPVDLVNERTSLPLGALNCRAEETATIEGSGPVRSVTCRDEAAKVDYKRYALDRGKTHYWVEGLAGYDPALRLALASLVTDRQQAGAVQVATTEVSDPASLREDPGRNARCRRGAAGSLFPQQWRAFRRESAEFFENLASRDSNDPRRLAKRWPTRACSNRTSAISPRPNVCSPRRPSASPSERRRAPAADPQLSRDQPAQPASAGCGGRCPECGDAAGRGRDEEPSKSATA